MFEELLLLLFFALVGIGVGEMLSAPMTGLLVAVVVWGLVEFVQLLRLKRWLDADASQPALRTSGLWGDVYRRAASLRQVGEDRDGSDKKQPLRLEEGVTALPYGIVITGPDGRIEWFNSAAAEALLLSQPSDLGREISHLVRQPDFVAALEGEEDGVKVELSIGGKHLVAHISSIGREGAHLIVVQDLSRVHYLERARSDLLGNVAHELKTPLTVVAGYAEIIAAEVKPGDKVSDAAGQIDKQAKRMNRIIDDLLMLERLEAGQLPVQNTTTVDVRPLVEEVVQELAVSMSGSRCTIETEVEAGATLHGDRGELHSVLSNLVGNALRYSPEGGIVRVLWSSDGDGDHLSVSDEGVGIAPVHLPRLTERFYRVDKSRSRDLGGIGLGLAIVKRVLRRHGASLRIESEPGKGSVFHCDFPRVAS